MQEGRNVHRVLLQKSSVRVPKTNKWTISWKLVTLMRGTKHVPQRLPRERGTLHLASDRCCWKSTYIGILQAEPDLWHTRRELCFTESKKWTYNLYHHQIKKKKKKFPNFAVLEVFTAWVFLAQDISANYVLWCLINSPNKCSEASDTAWHTVEALKHLGGGTWERRETIHWGKETEFDKTGQAHQPRVWRQIHSGLWTHSTEHALLKSSDRQGMALKPEKPVHRGPYGRHRNVPPIAYTLHMSEVAQKRPFSFSPGSSRQKVLFTTKPQ